MPFSFARFSIACLLIFICVSVVTTLMMTLIRMITIAGPTSAGA